DANLDAIDLHIAAPSPSHEPHILHNLVHVLYSTVHMIADSVPSSASMIASASSSTSIAPSTSSFSRPNDSVLDTLLQSRKSRSDREEMDLDKIRRFFEEHHRQRAEADVGEDPSGHGETEEEANEKEDESATPYEELLLVLVRKASNLLGAKTQSLAVMVCDVAATSLRTLAASRAADKKCLPLVHGLWEPLVCRLRRALREVDAGVAQAVLGVVEVLAACWREFVAAKYMRDLWPVCAQLVSSETRRNLQLDPRDRAAPSLRFSASFRAQAALLQTLSALLGDGSERLPAVDCPAVFSTLCPYLDDRQPPALQRLALDACSRLLRLDPDALWMPLMALARLPLPLSPDPSLLPPLPPLPADHLFKQLHISPKDTHHFQSLASQLVLLI
ncbi:MAG: hypothetical protein Q8P67_03550, partial [archaeon]|nr:hypothetical protein [archaeon]